MLDFIVLGDIPGTHLQITFAWVVFFVLVGLITVDYKIHRHHKNTEARAERVEVIRPGQV